MNLPASVEGRERVRLFCALRLPEPVLDAIEAWGRAELAERVVRRANLHITLAFLGHRPVGELAAIAAATREALWLTAVYGMTAILHRGTHEIDASRPLSQIVETLIAIGADDA